MDTNYSIYKKCRIKQHLSNNWSPFDEKAKQHWGSVEKRTLLRERSV